MMECSRRSSCKGGFSKWRTTRRRRRSHRGSVRLKVRKLQKLIPGGQGLKADRLFTTTANYILQLRLQLHVLQALSNIYQP
ncbi:hypothetical protein Dsin_010304 [Dipteronia sinensis]|uniref:Uncharacterized protein n=1 Tax=Dipteronia sinensis TaxID=43782 RepID=A0AAE0ATG4_9ROSI|nr:hypothetical protein Dsin_010304 [Dipteronia sinensis]